MLTPLAAYRAELAKRVAVHAPTTLDDTLAEGRYAREGETDE